MEAERDREFVFTDEDFNDIVERVKSHTGIKLAEHKRNMVYGRLARRLRDLQLSTFKDYCDFLESENGEVEIGNFVNAITTNLTSFFRESHHFDHLKEELKKIIANPHSGRRIRIWSSASSSGQEPYSIAMTVCEAIGNVDAWDIKILATDIDTNMLDKCKNGIYDEKSAEDLPPGYLKKYFTINDKQKKNYVVIDKLKKLITFKQLNLLEKWPMKGSFDFIFCRNVVIYFDKETQKDIFDRMASILKMGSPLYLGHSESMFKVCDRFDLIGRTIYKRIK